MDDRFSLENFKKWMSQQKPIENKSNRLVGLRVEAKIGAKRIAKHILSHGGDLEEVCEDFKKNGGVIQEVDGINFLIEVSSGTLKIHRCFVKKATDQDQ